MEPPNPRATDEQGITRRTLLRGRLALGGLGLLGFRMPQAFGAAEVKLPFDRGDRPPVAFPKKRPLMVMTTRPPQLETPFSIFNEGLLTPNDAFFVRWHLANIPIVVDENQFRLTIHGQVNQSLSWSPSDLQGEFETVELTAVCQCAGNSRGFFAPRVSGGQWGSGAMGNATGTGVRLRDLLKRAVLQANATPVRFNGLDQPVMDATSDFRKALSVDHAVSDHVIVAYAMNGGPLPMLNGFPLRLVVPGW